MIRTITANRYVTPLHEGGSLPAVVKADDGELYVMKFVGAGQGPKALIAELIAGELARELGFRMPEIVLLEMSPLLGRSEPNAEIQDLLQASTGLNLGMKFLPNALAFNLLLAPPPMEQLASEIVWFDAYITNVDRTARNVNMLLWQEELWLIDHGAALYFHHSWDDYLKQSQSPFVFIKQHTLLSLASTLPEADRRLRTRMTEAAIRSIVEQIPGQWLGKEESFANHQEHREAYVAYLLSRLDASANFVEEAVNAHAQLV